MRAAFATLVFTALVAANPVPAGVSSAIAPHQSPPPGCSPNYVGTFLISPVNVSTQKRDLDERNTQLGITLKNGILTDPVGRTGYIASNQQFQFDDPPQAGAIWTAGFSVCQNGSLALGSDVIWWKCLSGSFSNLYFKSIGGQCVESYLVTHGINGAGGPAPISNTPSASPTASSSIAASSSTNGTSGSAGASSSMASSTMAMNGTASASATGSASTTVTVSTSGTTTVVGGGHHTNTNGGTRTQGGQQTTTTGGGSPSPAASSSSVSPGAAVATLKADFFGLAAGVLAMAVL